MRFNLSASVKHVAQLLNPDLEIPNAPASTQPPPPSSSPSSSSSSARRSEHSTTRSRGNTLSFRSSLSSRRKRRQTAAAVYTPPTTSTSDDAEAAPAPILTSSIHADYTSRDPTLRFYNSVQQQQQQRQPPSQQQKIGRLSWKRRSMNPAATNSTKMSGNTKKKRASWNGFQNTQTPRPPLAAAAPTTTTTNAAPAHIHSSSVREADKSKPYFPLAGIARDGYSNDKEATATCFCGAVQLAFPVKGPGLLSTFVCNCTDCRKITASMFASNFTVKDEYLRHLRGRANLSRYSQATTIASGHTMTNFFCTTCGTLMYRVGAAFPGCSILRLGTVDDFNLAETKLKPTRELFVKDRVSWFTGVQGAGVKRKSAML